MCGTAGDGQRMSLGESIRVAGQGLIAKYVGIHRERGVDMQVTPENPLLGFCRIAAGCCVDRCWEAGQRELHQDCGPSAWTCPPHRRCGWATRVLVIGHIGSFFMRLDAGYAEVSGECVADADTVGLMNQ